MSPENRTEYKYGLNSFTVETTPKFDSSSQEELKRNMTEFLDHGRIPRGEIRRIHELTLGLLRTGFADTSTLQNITAHLSALMPEIKGEGSENLTFDIDKDEIQGALTAIDTRLGILINSEHEESTEELMTLINDLFIKTKDQEVPREEINNISERFTEKIFSINITEEARKNLISLFYLVVLRCGYVDLGSINEKNIDTLDVHNTYQQAIGDRRADFRETYVWLPTKDKKLRPVNKQDFTFTTR